MNTITTPQFDSFRAFVSHAETLHAELSTLNEATEQLEGIKTRIGNCLDEDEARQLLSEMRDAEEVVVIKQIRGKRIAADLESVFADACKACKAAQLEAQAILRQTPPKVVDAFSELVETCQHPSRKPRNPRSMDDVIQSFATMAIIERLDDIMRSVPSLYNLEKELFAQRLEVLKQAIAYLQRFHDGCIELDAESTRFVAACAVFRKAYAKH